MNSGRIEFNETTMVDPLSLIQLIQEDPMRFKLTSGNQLQFTHQSENAEAKLEFISSVLDKIKIIEQEAA